MEIKKEPLMAMVDEAIPLFIEHYKEIAHYLDIPLAPDYARYFEMEKKGALHIWTARDANKKLAAYAFYFLAPNLHYKTSLQARQDILFVRKENRGLLGAKLIKHCDEELRRMGVQVVQHHVKSRHNFGPMLERFGYELVDLIYVKRLDKG